VLGIGERAPQVTEQLALEQRCRHRRAVDRDERLVATRRQMMDRACDQLLAGARFSSDEHGRVAVGHTPHELDRLADRRAAAGDALGAGIGIGMGAEPYELALEREVIDRTRYRDRQGIDLHRFRDEVVRAGADRPDRGFQPTLAGDDDGEEIRILLAQLGAQLDARHLRHLDIGDDDIDRVRL
jgi:hypothetical protein